MADQATQSDGSGSNVALLASEEPSALAFASQSALATWVTDGTALPPAALHPAHERQYHSANESPEDSESPEEQRLLELGMPAAVADALQHPGQNQQRHPLNSHRDESSMIQKASLLGLLTSAAQSADKASNAEDDKDILSARVM